MAVAVALLCAARLDASVTTGAGARDDTATNTMVFVEPSLSATLTEPLTSLSLKYTPRFWTGDIAGSRHSATALFSSIETRNLSWGAVESFAYGRNELQLDPGLKRPFDNLDPFVPLVADELMSDTELYASYLVSRTVAINAGAGYFVYGGASAASQVLLPFQQTPQLYASVDDDLTRVDRISIGASASHTEISGGVANSLVSTNISWRRALAATTTATITLGASVRERVGADFLPVATGLLQHGIGHTDLQLFASTGPHQSRLTGSLVERTETGGAARWSFGDWSLRARAAYAHDDAVGALEAFGGDVVWKLSRRLRFSLGGEALFPSTQPTQSAVFSAFTYDFTGGSR